MRYVQTKDLGFNDEQVAVLQIDPNVGRQAEAIKAAVLHHPGVTHASASMLVPSTDVWTYGIQVKATGERMTLGTYKVDYDFLETYDMEIAAGRWFSEAFGTDSSAAVLNEEAARRLGFADPAEALGTPLIWADTREVNVVGVVEDFHATSFRARIEPMVILLESGYYYLSSRLHTEDVAATLAFLENTMRTFAPERPFEYFFVDERFNALHGADRQIGQVFATFAVLATFIACLGLFGLASYTASRRRREVGVRKVLGATAGSIVALLSAEFTRLVIVALVIAAPISYVAMQHWLGGFAYRVDISAPVFLIAGLTALVIAFLTVSYQAIRAALANPVQSLRHE